MNRLMDLVSDILQKRIDEINNLIVDELLDELIEIVLYTWQREPEVCFEELREKVIEKLNQRKEF
jgi:hypothetical protein